MSVDYLGRFFSHGKTANINFHIHTYDTNTISSFCFGVSSKRFSQQQFLLNGHFQKIKGVHNRLTGNKLTVNHSFNSIVTSN